MATKVDGKICIFGTGGFGRETLCCLIDSIAGTGLKINEIACFAIDDKYYSDKEVLGVKVVPLSLFNPAEYRMVIGVGDPNARKKIIETLPKQTEYATIIHPSAVISEWVEIGKGSIITAGTIITCNINIGKHAHLNLHATVGHDCQIGDFFTAAPAVNISGKCVFGDLVYLGTNASVREGVKICDDVIIGMGGVVVKDVNEAGVYIGNPLKKLEKKN